VGVREERDLEEARSVNHKRGERRREAENLLLSVSIGACG